MGKVDLDFIEQHGYAIVEDVIDRETLQRLREGLHQRIYWLIDKYHRRDGLPPYEKTGDIAVDTAYLLSHWPSAYEHLDISLPMGTDYRAIRTQWEQLLGDDWEAQAGVYADEAIFDVVAHPGTLAVAQQLIGSNEVLLNPTQHVRIKPPRRALPADFVEDANMIRTLWHQDEAVLTEEVTEQQGVIWTIWVALSDATIENGCMYAVDGSHREGASLATHCPGKKLVGEIYIDEDRIDRSRLVPLTVPAGGIVILHQRTVHGAGDNESDDIRWSLDLRYQSPAHPTGRDCFPSFLLHSDDAASVVDSPRQYRDIWLHRRDQLMDGLIEATFNARWLPNRDHPLCA